MCRQYYIASMMCVFLLSFESFSQIPVTDSVLENPASPLLLVDVPLTTALSGLGYNLKDGDYIESNWKIAVAARERDFLRR